MKNQLINYWISCLLVLPFSVASAADTTPPKFRDYPVSSVYRGAPAKVKLVTADDRLFRTRLREAAIPPAVFAGEYIIGTWGCGTGCLMGAAVSLKTGKIHWLPGGSLSQYGMTNWDNDDPLTYRLNSRLLVVYALRGEVEDDEGKVHFYKLSAGAFEGVVIQQAFGILAESFPNFV